MLLLFYLMFWVPFCVSGPCPGPSWGDPGPGRLLLWDLGPGQGPSEGSCLGARAPILQGGGDWVLQSSLLSMEAVQINCSCALEFPQHTNLHDVKQLGGNPSMPCTEAELPMSYGD